ncbi:hypothetical protein L873DRAFT_18324 [Choiromyces venosus 120613-1]|uniref:Uncharacterized protein n=1 Tax=Choiromyces venosus 120613-1 TaxID=1336337 RepID=A0A3N4K6M1_9PEZI|nr:hypothetical protein L873DRAFT_18324 [Choiromyces venosus 120613-1]
MDSNFITPHPTVAPYSARWDIKKIAEQADYLEECANSGTDSEPPKFSFTPQSWRMYDPIIDEEAPEKKGHNISIIITPPTPARSPILVQSVTQNILPEPIVKAIFLPEVPEEPSTIAIITTEDTVLKALWKRAPRAVSQSPQHRST